MALTANHLQGRLNDSGQPYRTFNEFDDTDTIDSNETYIVIANLDQKASTKNRLGKLVSGTFAVGCGINAAAALATLVTGIPFILLSAVLCSATAYANYRMTNNDVSNIFTGGILGLFKKEIVIETTDEDEGYEGVENKRRTIYLSWKKSLLMVGGLILSLTFGASFFALTYSSTVALASAFTVLAGVSFVLPPLGIVLGAITFICLTSLMAKAFSDLIKTDNLGQKIKEGIIKLFCWDPDRDEGKSTARFVCERALTGIAITTLSVGIIGLVIYGQFSTLHVCATNLSDILLNISNGSATAIQIASTIIGEVCGLAAQIPFILKTSLTPVLALFSAKPKTVRDTVDLSPKKTFTERAEDYVLYVTAFLSSAATAAIALTGKALTLLPVLGGMGAFLNSFFGSVVNAMLSAPVKTPAMEVPLVSSTRKIAKDLALEKELMTSFHFHHKKMAPKTSSTNKKVFTVADPYDDIPTNGRRSQMRLSV